MFDASPLVGGIADNCVEIVDAVLLAPDPGSAPDIFGVSALRNLGREPAPELRPGHTDHPLSRSPNIESVECRVELGNGGDDIRSGGVAQIEEPNQIVGLVSEGDQHVMCAVAVERTTHTVLLRIESSDRHRRTDNGGCKLPARGDNTTIGNPEPDRTGIVSDEIVESAGRRHLKRW